jgi:hypothetical protein
MAFKQSLMALLKSDSESESDDYVYNGESGKSQQSFL